MDFKGNSTEVVCVHVVSSWKSLVLLLETSVKEWLMLPAPVLWDSCITIMTDVCLCQKVHTPSPSSSTPPALLHKECLVKITAEVS